MMNKLFRAATGAVSILFLVIILGGIISVDKRLEDIETKVDQIESRL